MNNNQHSVLTDFINPIVLRGQVGYTVNGDRIVIEVAEIANDRDEQNLSGTLALELWALAEPYQGGSFSGYNLAATQLEHIQGQHCLRGVVYDLAFQQPPVGTWNLVLMLREWEYGAYITRDFVNFAAPYTVQGELPAARPQVTRHDDNVIEVSFREVGQNAVEPAAAVESKADAKAKPEVKAKPATKAAGKTKKAKAEPALVSVNKSSVEELAAVKGINQKLAQTIVDSRPYQSLADLLKVKGMGQKVLDKVEDKISL